MKKTVDPSKALVIIPTYNESENVPELVNAIFSIQKEVHILFVDDNSPDGTAGIIKDIQKIELKEWDVLPT